MIRLRVKEVAEGQGLNIQALAVKSGIAYSTILDLWHDRARRIDKNTLSRLCEALGVGAGDLVVYEESGEKDLEPALAA